MSLGLVFWVAKGVGCDNKEKMRDPSLVTTDALEPIRWFSLALLPGICETIEIWPGSSRTCYALTSSLGKFSHAQTNARFAGGGCRRRATDRADTNGDGELDEQETRQWSRGSASVLAREAINLGNVLNRAIEWSSAMRRFCFFLVFLLAAAAWGQQPGQEDPGRARRLFQRELQGEQLTTQEAAYLQRAIEERLRPPTRRARALLERETTGLKPLTEMSGEDRYEGEEGGLYGAGRNTPTDEHRQTILQELARIEPLDAAGKAAEDGKIGFISISMSNATQEFSTFKRLADADKDKSTRVVIVDCAQGGQAMAEWAPADAAPWREAERRLEAARVSPQQVQVAWVKLANKGPRGTLKEHGEKLERDTLALVQNAKRRFPNLHVVYLGSRIYGGYTSGMLNPEPYAYESAFVARWLIQKQLKEDAALNYDATRGDVKAPLLVWGPYFWGDGTTPRREDKLVWLREDFVRDGTHPSNSGREKVSTMLLEFCKRDELAKGWFVGK